MKVLSVIVAHPLRKVSGATNAGMQLTQAVSKLVDTELAIMWDRDEVETREELLIWRVSCNNRLGPLARLAPRFVRVPLYDSRIPELVRDGSYDLVHIHNLVPTMAAARLARACQRRGVPYVVSTHGFVELSSYARINGFGPVKSALIHMVMTRPFRRVVSGAARILALSDCEGSLLAGMGVSDDRIDVVTNGVNEMFLAPADAAELREMRAKLPLDTSPVLLFMGSLHAYKGVDTFLKALAKVAHPFRAVVAGRFKDPDEPERLLQAAGVSPQLRSRIVFTGSVTDRELRALYQSATLFVYPTAGDTLPLVVLEAMASGLPVVSTRVGGVPYAVADDCGLLTSPGDPAATAAAIDAMLRSPERMRTAGACARARVLNTFRWERSARAAVAAYGRVLDGRGRPRRPGHQARACRPRSAGSRERLDRPSVPGL